MWLVWRAQGMYSVMGKHLEKQLLGRLGWEDNIKMDRREIRCEDLKWLQLAQSRAQ